MVEFGEMETHPGLVPRRERNAKPQIDGCDERRPLRPLVDHRVLAHQKCSPIKISFAGAARVVPFMVDGSDSRNSITPNHA